MPIEIAPVIYPTAVDPAKDESLKTCLKCNKKFIVGDYGRRPSALFAGNTPSSTIASASLPPPFHSSFSDPNHPANNFSITALVTGGKYGISAKGFMGWRETGDDGKLRPVNEP